ncbi:CLUMA_CG017635, isoform A [Clunio marinus]|uniref:CLUMA_CG017635, isoform A n=1 Tax=Clunio marinus TaxID=568069 RepID=A0A1J1IWH4_9DIPT|nr:CLUMA_CG017635, isoform A [Clunio marinus]
MVEKCETYGGLEKEHSRKKQLQTTLPSIGGRGFFSSVSACFNPDLSNCSTPFIKLLCAFSAATAKKAKAPQK